MNASHMARKPRLTVGSEATAIMVTYKSRLATMNCSDVILQTVIIRENFGAYFTNIHALESMTLVEIFNISIGPTVMVMFHCNHCSSF